MSIGLFPELAFVFSVLFGLSVLVLSRFLPIHYAIGTAFIKFVIPFIYFGFFFDGSWLALDDVTYFQRGILFLGKYQNPLQFFFDPRAFFDLFYASIHAGYYWYCYLAVFLFGPYYFSPVFLNVFIHVLSSFALFHILKMGKFSPGYCKWLTIFYLLHWNSITWSSFLNYKDILVLFFIIMLVYGVFTIVYRRGYWALVLILFSLYCLYFLRFFIIPIFVLALITWFFREKKIPIYVFAIVIGVLSVGVLAVGDFGRFLSMFTQVGVSPSPVGAVKFLITPIPFNIVDNERYQLLDAYLYWLFLPATLWGVLLLWKRYAVARFCIILAALIFVLHTLVPDLRTPRKRFQFSFVIIWAQFEAVYYFYLHYKERLSEKKHHLN